MTKLIDEFAVARFTLVGNNHSKAGLLLSARPS